LEEGGDDDEFVAKGLEGIDGGMAACDDEEDELVEAVGGRKSTLSSKVRWTARLKRRSSAWR